MAEANSRPTPCPRCGAPITGAFKFCPTCAYRLQGPEDPGEASAAAGTPWPAALAGALLLLVVVGVVFLGIVIFRDQPTNGPPPAGNGSSPLRGRLTVHDHLPEYFKTIWPGKAADISPDPEVHEFVLVGLGRMFAFEITRGMYAEFLDKLAEDRAAGKPWPVYLEFMEELWRPPPPVIETPANPTPEQEAEARNEQRAYEGRLVYANSYLDVWWDMVEHHLRQQKDDEGNALDLAIARPEDLEARLPPRYDILLLVPPSWVYLTPFEELAWRLPPNTENLPVTEVSWYEALAFKEYVNDELDLETMLPSQWEWLLAGSGGDADRLYPWGDEAYYQASNSLNHWGPYDQPRLRPVDYRYSDKPGLSRQGLYAMSGNAREWCRNSRLVSAADRTGESEDIDEREFPQAPTCGGSFRMGIRDCQVTTNSVKDEEKIDRFDDVGFRLWVHASRP